MAVGSEYLNYKVIKLKKYKHGDKPDFTAYLHSSFTYL